MTITDSPVSGADECTRDLHKKYCDVVEELRSHKFIKEPFIPNYYYYTTTTTTTTTSSTTTTITTTNHHHYYY